MPDTLFAFPAFVYLGKLGLFPYPNAFEYEPNSIRRHFPPTTVNPHGFIHFL